ncbi:hypothetical protein [Sedimenticola selenatireducens]|uniref:Uncharacterized protein n=1 Tax=Sedimenticola selenatireducens TaxID=191960 RepID=A0A557SI25_9GAMM|nr:hypothetical protein [Sedimenticola selenatireducens]TVO77086.1 hypothetical protein FHP88_06605 [Sedimenticola selenatireducens]TVT64529.1 MAG: hypothetical protein FHK78_09850 [Sedimenticola selenatireducens]
MIKLVELDKSTFYAKEVDVVRLKREAGFLSEFLETLSVDELNLKNSILPFCKAAIERPDEFPIDIYDEPLPITHMLDSGITFPAHFLEIYSQFFNTAVGARIDLENRVEKGDKLYAPMEFE